MLPVSEKWRILASACSVRSPNDESEIDRPQNMLSRCGHRPTEPDHRLSHSEEDVRQCHVSRNIILFSLRWTNYQRRSNRMDKNFNYCITISFAVVVGNVIDKTSHTPIRTPSTCSIDVRGFLANHDRFRGGGKSGRRGAARRSRSLRSLGGPIIRQ